MPRAHRRVHHPRTNCRCPEGTKRVETCSKKGDNAKCKGRNMGCIDMVTPPGAKKPVPRFVKMICDPEAGPVEQWKPPKGYRKGRKRKPQSTFILPPQQVAMRLPDESLPLFRRLRNNAALVPNTPRRMPEQQTSFRYDEPLFNRARNTPRPSDDTPSIPPWMKL